MQALYDAKTEEAYGLAFQNQNFDKNRQYAREVIACLSKIPIELLNETTNGIDEFYSDYLKKIVIGMYDLLPNSYEPKGIKSFKFKKETFYLPTEETLLNDVTPMANESVETFIEGMELRTAMQDKIIRDEGLTGLAAVFARKKDTVYNEAETIKQAQEFEDLTMDNIWEVFFCLRDLFKRSEQIMNMFSQGVVKVRPTLN